MDLNLCNTPPIRPGWQKGEIASKLWSRTVQDPDLVSKFVFIYTKTRTTFLGRVPTSHKIWNPHIIGEPESTKVHWEEAHEHEQRIAWVQIHFRDSGYVWQHNQRCSIKISGWEARTVGDWGRGTRIHFVSLREIKMLDISDWCLTIVVWTHVMKSENERLKERLLTCFADLDVQRFHKVMLKKKIEK